jgi:predicted enzyme related to lactoylglutathione lyase
MPAKPQHTRPGATQAPPGLRELAAGSSCVAIANPRGPSAVVHLELHTDDLPAAGAFLWQLLRWGQRRIHTTCGAYHAFDAGGELGGGIVACGTAQALWLPYVQVDRVERATDHATRLGATVLLAPREGPAGWRSVVSLPAAGQIALWQQKG